MSYTKAALFFKIFNTRYRKIDIAGLRGCDRQAAAAEVCAAAGVFETFIIFIF